MVIIVCARQLALSMLQAMYNGSDSFTEEELKEKVYWQYFCRYEYLQKDLEVSEATIRRFRNALGEEGYNEILSVPFGRLRKTAY